MGRKSDRLPRPSMATNNNNNIKMRPFNPFVPCSSQGSVAVYGEDDTYSDLNTDFGGSLAPSSSGVSVDSDDDDVFFPKFWPPMDSSNHYADSLKMIEDFLVDDKWVPESSDNNCFSFAMSNGEETASASCNHNFYFKNQMIEEDAVDSLPKPLHRDNTVELNHHSVKGPSFGITNSYKETTVNNNWAFWPDTSVDPQNSSILIENDYDGETSQPDEKLEIYNCNRNYEMSQFIHPSQSKKFPDSILESDSDIISRNENISIFPVEWQIEEIKAPGSSLFLGDASMPSSPAGCQSISLESYNSHVRFKIKSFMVPEFFVEVPETASVGFLKKAIMEKTTAMVGDGGHLDVVLQGEDIRDENKILPKTSVSNQNLSDIILEPHYIQEVNGSSPHLSSIPFPPQPQRWCTPSSSAHERTTGTSPDSIMNILGTIFQDNHDRLECPTYIPVTNNTSSMAVVAFPAVNGALNLVSEDQKIKAFKCKKRLAMDVDALDEGSVQKKSKSSMNIKRRKTEFFSISEVEALVQKVEELGTGRWQKIKEQAFGNDSRRTYMDVKDKWRSLVKTAKRPVDERRGVLLPQGLLDRVLAIETCKLKYSDT